MKQKHHRKTHKKRNIVLILLLAVLCIGGAELMACRFFEPESYERVVAPVRRAAQTALGIAQNAAHRIAALSDAVLGEMQTALLDLGAQTGTYLTELSAPQPEPEPETQMAGDPTLTDPFPVTDTAITELVEQNGRQVLTGGNVDIVYFCQSDEPWASRAYGSDDIGRYGCGPVAMAMVVTSLTDIQTDPEVMSRWAAEHGYWAKRSGSYLSIVEGTARAYGLEAESFSGRTPDEILDALLNGKLLVALMGPGHFTSRGHFILLRGSTLSGEVLVADPNSLERSLSVWDPQVILDELSASTHNGAPLWAISVDSQELS